MTKLGEAPVRGLREQRSASGKLPSGGVAVRQCEFEALDEDQADAAGESARGDGGRAQAPKQASWNDPHQRGRSSGADACRHRAADQPHDE